MSHSIKLGGATSAAQVRTKRLVEALTEDINGSGDQMIIRFTDDEPAFAADDYAEPVAAFVEDRQLVVPSKLWLDPDDEFALRPQSLLALKAAALTRHVLLLWAADREQFDEALFKAMSLIGSFADTAILDTDAVMQPNAKTNILIIDSKSEKVTRFINFLNNHGRDPIVVTVQKLTAWAIENELNRPSNADNAALETRQAKH